MKTIIKIDLASIKRNPRAGRTSTKIAGLTTCSFSYERLSAKEFVKIRKLEDQRKGVFIQSFSIGVKGSLSIYKVDGFCDYPELQLELPQAGLVFEVKTDIQTINHQPEPQYLYRYTPTDVQCSFCGKMVMYSNIQVDYDEFGEWTICPVCQHPGTFDFEFEKIESVTNK